MADKKRVVPGSVAYFQELLEAQCDETIFGLSGFVRSDLAERIEDACDAIRESFATLGSEAYRPAPILIYGKTGTGKEVVCDSIFAGLQKKGVLKTKEPVKVNCAAISQDLFESALFGHVKGAFTGATRAKTGYLEEAQDNVLFLDEIGELPPYVQAKLLRAIESGTFRKVGDTKDKKVRCAFVAATNRSKRLREDIWERFKVMIPLRPLRERRIDIFAILYGKLRKELGPSSEWTISRYTFLRLVLSPWKGNVRELLRAADQSIRQAKRAGRTSTVELVYVPEKPIDLRDEENLRETWNRFVDYVRSLPGRRLLSKNAYDRKPSIAESSDKKPRWSIPQLLWFIFAVPYGRDAEWLQDIREATEVDPGYTIECVEFILDHDLLRLRPAKRKKMRSTETGGSAPDTAESAPDLTGYKPAELEREYYRQLYQKHGGDVGAIAKATGKAKSTVDAKLAQLGIRKKRRRRDSKNRILAN